MAREENAGVKKEAGHEITWKAAEYEHSAKDTSWYWMIGGAVIFFLILSLWQKNFFFAVFVVIAGVMVGMFGRRRPNIIDFKANDEGIGYGTRFLAYDQIEKFAVRNRPGHLDEIIIHKKTTINPVVHIPIDEKLRERVQSLMREKLPEIEHQESLVDAFAEWLGF